MRCPFSGPTLKRAAAGSDANVVGARPRRASLVPPMVAAAHLVVFAGPATAQAADSPIAVEHRSASTQSNVSTESSQVMPKWTPAIGLTLGHERSLLRESAADIRARTRADMLFAFGLFDWTEVSVHLPLVLRQRVDTPTGEIERTGLGDLRVGLKGTILRLPLRGLGLGLQFDVTAPTGDAGSHTGIGRPSYAPQVLLEHQGPRGIRSAFNAGYLARHDTSGDGRVGGDEVTLRGAVRIPLATWRPIAWVGELDGRVPLVRGANGSILGRTGLRGQLRSGIVLGLFVTGASPGSFAGGEIGGALSIAWAPAGRTKSDRPFDGSPRPRASSIALRHDQLVVVQTSPPPTPRPADDPDGDGLRAGADRCPNAAEDRDRNDDSDGCPELDDDRDGIADAYDLCPRAPEIVNGALDLDGCPDRIDGGGRTVTLASIDPRELAPALTFVDNGTELTADSRAALDRWIELARLNPWIDRLDVAVYVHATRDSAADRGRAQARADAIVAHVTAAGLDPWRVGIRELAAVAPDVPERVRVAVIGQHDGLRALAPDRTVLERWITEAVNRRTAPTPVGGARGPIYEAQGPANQSGGR